MNSHCLEPSRLSRSKFVGMPGILGFGSWSEEVTLRMREGADSRSFGSKSSVRRSGPTKLTARVFSTSWVSSVNSRVLVVVPALLTST
ncbi:hypothetical protein BC936DRAFT_145539 [Jimgerdemannia flammicorona]|uniref:Uncharacterized protein n=2 Tax=Jimgerdemannia flammicorona TaxID=994334 RepID=A0A433QDV3_9FUNG|nr:hypothetical protein BC936DRAFT_145539 [Jimgerdemannia flammicorona]RUS27958.1 hypothetical protein BC938DRAFT_482521 [Jimgerdemannia flammicorona]